ncbi:MAG: hypothetical protein ACK5QE_00300 [Sphingobacteriia bacterium]|jgi:hypothetical protein
MKRIHTPLVLCLAYLVAGGLAGAGAQVPTPPGYDPTQVQEVAGEAEQVVYQWAQIDSARAQARDLARIQALEKAYGALVLQSNATTVENRSSGQRARTYTRFTSIANTYVKGNWLKTTHEHTQVDTLYLDAKGRLHERPGRKTRTEYRIRCRVEGLASEIRQPQVQFRAQPLRCLEGAQPQEQPCATLDFQHADRFFLHFRSPQAGYLSVWLDNQQQAQCLLPYVQMPKGMESGMPIEAERAYVFFSSHPQHNYFDQPAYAEDELQLYTDETVSYERLYIVFSTQPQVRPLLEESRTVSRQLDNPLQGYRYPRRLDSQQFQAWLILGQSMQGYQVQVMDISIAR